jgi:hypothetical protein
LQQVEWAGACRGAPEESFPLPDAGAASGRKRAPLFRPDLQVGALHRIPLPGRPVWGQAGAMGYHNRAAVSSMACRVSVSGCPSRTTSRSGSLSLQACAQLHQSQSTTCHPEPMDFFVWQERSREFERHCRSPEQRHRHRPASRCARCKRVRSQ